MSNFISDEVNRQRSQYQELYNIGDRDELLHCIVYEFAIRDIKDKLIEMFKVFSIENDTIVLNTDEIEKQIFNDDVDTELLIQAKTLSDNDDYLDQIYTYWILKIEDDLNFYMGLGLIDLYLDYDFFSDELKKIFYMIITNCPLYDEKDNSNDDFETITYHNSKFSRVSKAYPKMNNDDFRDIKTHYQLNYKRPIIRPTILSNNKNADITINTDLPKEILLQQISKLIDIMKIDSSNIPSNLELNYIADDIEFDGIRKEIFECKENFIDKFIIFDYLEIRLKEIDITNKELKLKKEKRINEIKSSLEMDKLEKQEQIKLANESFSKITKKDIIREISRKLNYTESTIETYIKDFKKLKRDQNYLKLLQGKIIGE